jgi:FAD:protein FMN transferase
MRRARPLLGTIVEIAAEGDDDRLTAAVEAAFASIAEVHRLMSFHEPDSDVSRINQAEAGRETSIDSQTFRVLTFARTLSDLTKGAFDVTIAPALIARGFLPEHSSQTTADQNSDFEARYFDLVLLPHDRAVWRRKGRIDLGGIAKGYAVDCAIEALRSHGVTSAIVNAGGDLRCFGKPYPIHVRDPGTPTNLLCLGWLEDAGLASSSGYFSGLDIGGRHVDPLVDPAQRSCTSWEGSISVAAHDGMTADALTKVVRLAPELAPGILEQFDAHAIVIDNVGSRSCGRPLLRQDFGA